MSTSISYTSQGRFIQQSEYVALIATDLPEPVVPATSRFGISQVVDYRITADILAQSRLASKTPSKTRTGHGFGTY